MCAAAEYRCGCRVSVPGVPRGCRVSTGRQDVLRDGPEPRQADFAVRVQDRRLSWSLNPSKSIPTEFQFQFHRRNCKRRNAQTISRRRRTRRWAAALARRCTPEVAARKLDSARTFPREVANPAANPNSATAADPRRRLDTPRPRPGRNAPAVPHTERRGRASPGAAMAEFQSANATVAH